MFTQDNLKRAGAELLLALAIFAIVRTVAAGDMKISEHARAVHASLAPAAKPSVREWILQEAKKISNDPKAGEAAVKADIKSRFAGQNLSDNGIEAVLFLVMMQMAQDAQSDMKTIIDEAKATNKKKAAQRQSVNQVNPQRSALATATTTNSKPAVAKVQTHPVENVEAASAAKTDSLNDLSEEQQLRLQMVMDRNSKYIETISNIMKKVSDTSSNIISNLK